MIVLLCTLLLTIPQAVASAKNSKYCVNFVLDDEKKCPGQVAANPTTALLAVRNKWILFAGESTLRQIYYQFLGLLRDQDADLVKDEKDVAMKGDVTTRISGSRFTFKYLPYYDNITQLLTSPLPTIYGRPPDLLVFDAGLHDLLYNKDKREKAWSVLSDKLGSYLSASKKKIPILWISMPQLKDDALTGNRLKASQFKNESVFKDKMMIQKDMKLYSNFINHMDVYHPWTEPSEQGCTFDGMHSMLRARRDAEAFVSALTWLESDGDGVMDRHKITVGQVFCFGTFGLIIAFVVTAELIQRLAPYFYSLLCVKKGYQFLDKSTMSWDFQDDVELEVVKSEEGSLSQQEALVQPEKTIKKRTTETKGEAALVSSKKQLYGIRYYREQKNVCRAGVSFFSVVILTFLLDGPKHLIFSPELKPTYSRDWFIFIHLVILLVSWMSMASVSSRGEKFIGRQQTEEWKGIMQIGFVLYHYFDASEAYNIIRVFIASYVWMTGFGNTCYFLKRNDFGMARLGYMMLRLNWLVFWICLALNQELMLYYICPLHTFFFFFTYCVNGILWKYNHVTNDDGQQSINKRFMALKILGGFFFLCLMFEINGTFIYFWDIPVFKQLLTFYGSFHEWEFRTRLDHYSSLIGIACAAYLQHYIDGMKWIEKQTRNVELAIKWAISLVTIAVLLIWRTKVLRLQKFSYNALHPYTSFIPYISYIILRNISKRARNYYSTYLAWGGTITLETYILQYHMYMLDDAKSILVMIPGYKLCNFVLVTIFYVVLSKVAFDSSQVLNAYFLPVRTPEKKTVPNKVALKNMLRLTLLVSGGYILSWILLSVYENYK